MTIINTPLDDAYASEPEHEAAMVNNAFMGALGDYCSIAMRDLELCAPTTARLRNFWAPRPAV
jgi:hypothetical protein